MNKLKIVFNIKASVFWTLAFVVLVFLVSWTPIAEVPKPFLKKIHKEILSLWGEELKIDQSNINGVVVEELKQLGVETLLEVSNGVDKQGLVIWAKARSKFEYFDYAIYYDFQQNIKAVRILQYREDYGGEIGSKRWLKQFEGLNANSPIEIGQDIQGISGATISYKAITNGVNNITKTLQKLSNE